MLKHRILACLLTLSAIAAAPDRKLDTNRAPEQWLAFIGAKPGMKVLDIFAVYG